MKEPRAPHTYRAARRNYALRELKAVWGPQYYYHKHNPQRRRGIVSRILSKIGAQ